MALTLERTALPYPVPNEVRDLPSFRAWIQSADLSEWPPIHFFNGQVWLEPRFVLDIR